VFGESGQRKEEVMMSLSERGKKTKKRKTMLRLFCSLVVLASAPSFSSIRSNEHWSRCVLSSLTYLELGLEGLCARDRGLELRGMGRWCRCRRRCFFDRDLEVRDPLVPRLELLQRLEVVLYLESGFDL